METGKVTEPYLQLCKNTEIGQTHAHWYKGKLQCFDAACAIQLSDADVHHAAHPRGEYGQEQLTYSQVAPCHLLNYARMQLNFKSPIVKGDKVNYFYFFLKMTLIQHI